MTYESGEWYRPDTAWKHDNPSGTDLAAALEQAFDRPAAAASALLEGILAQFGAGVDVEIRLVHADDEAPIFVLLGLEGAGSDRKAVCNFADCNGSAWIACHDIAAVGVIDIN